MDSSANISKEHKTGTSFKAKMAKSGPSLKAYKVETHQLVNDHHDTRVSKPSTSGERLTFKK